MKAVESTRTYKNFIGGAWTTGAGETYATVNPTRPGEQIGRFQRSAPADIDGAVEAAAAALPGWSATPAPRRGALLLEAWRLLRERAEEFAATLTLETGKAIADARGEITRALNVLEFTAGEGRRFTGQTVPSELPGNVIYTRRRPLGVVAVITPWNFPVAIPIWKIAPALVCGNTVVFKPATTTPLCAVRIVEVFAAAGLPGGVLNLITGSGGTLGDRLIGHLGVRAISFTGSTDVGAGIYGRASAAMKRVQCEMGGKNALVVMPDAALDLAVQAVIQGAYGFCGQRCTATSRVIVHEQVLQPFLDALLPRVRALRVGDPTDPQTDMGPLASESQLQKVQEYLEVGRREGATLLLGGGRPSIARDGGYFVEPVVFTGVTPQMRIAREEIFGPVLSVLTCRDLADAVEIVNDSEFGFKAAIYSSSVNDVMRFADAVDVAMVHINTPTLGGEAHAPFGGRKNSGVGMKEQGRAAMEFFSEETVIYLDYTGGQRDARFL
ncbi:MAG TPA: aldehyde dehydrogenase family protein [bacterium]|jgi:aldehyde dehydrogenase (NAD+)|nr:aldehyde dehydrogenase family protein [bacterium]